MQHTDRYDDVSDTTNMKGVNAKEIEIKGNEVEINRQRDYLQSILLHRYADIHSHYAQKEDKIKERKH